MKDLMMDTPLLITSLMEHAERNFPEQEIVSISSDNPNFRYTYKDAFTRTRQLANALNALGISLGDHVGTLAWYEGKVAKWWIPDDVVFVDTLPHTATGKIQKFELRQEYKDYKLPEVDA